MLSTAKSTELNRFASYIFWQDSSFASVQSSHTTSSSCWDRHQLLIVRGSSPENSVQKMRLARGFWRVEPARSRVICLQLRIYIYIYSSTCMLHMMHDYVQDQVQRRVQIDFSPWRGCLAMEFGDSQFQVGTCMMTFDQMGGDMVLQHMQIREMDNATNFD